LLELRTQTFSTFKPHFVSSLQ